MALRIGIARYTRAGTAIGLNGSRSATVEYEPATFKAMTEIEVKQTGFQEAFENSASRIWLDLAPEQLCKNHLAWYVVIPRPPDGGRVGVGFTRIAYTHIGAPADR